MPFTMIAWGEERITSALTSVLNACTPLFAAAFSAWLLRARLRPPQLAGLVIALAGVAVVAGLGGGDLAGSSFTGTLGVVAGSAGYGFGFAYAHRFVEGLSPIRLAAGQLATAALLLTPGTAVELAGGGVEFTPLVVLCLLLLGGLGTGYAYVLNYRILKDVGGTGASLVTYLIPIVGVAAGVLVLDEPFSLRQVVGALVIIFGIALVQGRLLGPKPTQEPDAAPPPATDRAASR
jgi:drug/metabolite transporter (DMT)-like permease